MQQPLISLITVVYNGGHLLAETLRSAVSQTYANIELVIVDGGSSDNTVAVAKQFEGHIGTLISEKDRGIYDAMNKGVKAAKGEWVYFLNAGDSFYDNRVLADVFEGRDLRNTDFIYAKVETVNEPTGINYITGNPVTIKDFYRKIPICHQSTFARREAFERIGYFNDQLRISADTEWMVRLFKDDESRALYIDRIIAYYDIQGTSYHRRMLSQRELLQYSDRYFPFMIAFTNKLMYPLVYLKVWIIRTFQHTSWFKKYRELKFGSRVAGKAS
jgi:glycosyltransferase involved in cell wall biosynthesis